MTHPIHPSTARFIPRFATLAAALLPLAILPPLATAQTKPQADEAVVLEKMVIEDIPADQSILATRPSTSLYGFEEIIRETPRSVFQVTKAHLDNDTIQNYGDLSRYSPSVQRGTVSPFSVPKLRGGSGDTLRNNIVLFNTAVRPLNNNAWEAADIVAGIPSVIQGNTSRTAGYVNYVTKKPYFGENQTELTFRLGRLGRDAATSYSQFSAQLDHSTELVKDRLALRFSLLTANADLYWGNAEANSDDIFAALTWKPSSRLTVDLNFSYTRSDGLNSSGINRVTQDLIDNWNYVAGRYTPIITSSGTAYRLSADGTKWEYGAGYASSIPVGTGTWETAASVDTGTPIASNPTVGQLTGWYLHDANKRTVKVTGDQTYYANDGSNKSYEYIAQAITSYRINENFSLRNNTIYQYSDNSTHEYDVKWDIHSNKMFESRFEFITDNLFGGKIRHQSNSGFSFRYLDNFCDGLYNTNNAEGISTYADVTVPGSLGVSYALNGTPLSAILDKGPGSGTPNSTAPGGKLAVIHSNYGWLQWTPSYALGGEYRGIGLGTNSGVGNLGGGPIRDNILKTYNFFSEHKFDFGEKWTWRFGARLTYVDDYIVVSPLTKRILARSPELVAALGPNLNLDDDADAWNGDINTSLSFRPAAWLNLYLAYDYNISNQGCGCCQAQNFTAMGNLLSDEWLETKSKLYEAGAKFELIQNKLFATAAWFRQTRNNPITDTTTNEVSMDDYLYQGVELSVSYQPSVRLSTGANYSHLRVTYYGGPKDGIEPAGNPADSASLWAAWRFDGGLGLKASASYVSARKVNEPGTINLPAQHQFDTGVFYAAKNWRLDLDISNLTDEKNWSAAGGFGGDGYGTLLAAERFGISGKFTYRF